MGFTPHVKLCLFVTRGTLGLNFLWPLFTKGSDAAHMTTLPLAPILEQLFKCHSANKMPVHTDGTGHPPFSLRLSAYWKCRAECKELRVCKNVI